MKKRKEKKRKENKMKEKKRKEKEKEKGKKEKERKKFGNTSKKKLKKIVNIIKNRVSIV